MPNNIVITGANRGIGLRLAQTYVDDGQRVYAACRSPETATELASLAEASGGSLSLHPLDVSSETQISAFAAVLKGTPVDVLINNAGVYAHKGLEFGQLDAADWLRCMHVNTVAPVMVTQALIDNIAAGKRKLVATITSKMGSIADNTSGGSYAYRSSKTALNSAMRSLAIDLHDRGISVFVLHPGWVRTDMGGPRGLITVDESVSQLRRIIDQAGMAQSGKFFDRDGSEIPW
ncbi:MAG: SDR family oxidoreductase [Gammaproteobacteria bacterium]|nr:SDR family oxidoreductase [Gammaproteobacteria bacterium]NNF59709.1 SDR family oxidoreductase [Gammaproteobacteria bacterium]